MFLPADHPRRAAADALKASGHEALAAMERHLHRLPWFGGEHYGIADIALFAYTHVAEDGGFDLGAYPACRALDQARADAARLRADARRAAD
jgi:glutathione S-transferase